jgi:hypothetical protein
MAKFTVQIRCNNAAFDPDPAPEVARILREISDKINREGLSGFFETIRDVNGNDVGAFAIKPDDYK